MNKRLLPFLFSILLLAQSAVAQTVRIGDHEAITKWTPAAGTLTSTDAKQTIQQILDAIGAKANFIIQPANIDNAAAVTYGGKRYILYSPSFMRDLTAKTGTVWGPISVLAHEVGHHLTTRPAGATQQQMELQADEFSGFALRKMGATVEESQAAMMTLANYRATRTHPAQDDRLIAIENGWHKANAELTGVAYTPKTKAPPPVQPSVAGMTVNPASIVGQVVFNAAPQSKIYITKNLNLVQLKENAVATIGKIAALNSSEFPYVIYDSSNTQLLVSRSGNIVTKSGRQVGVLKSYATRQ